MVAFREVKLNLTQVRAADVIKLAGGNYQLVELRRSSELTAGGGWNNAVRMETYGDLFTVTLHKLSVDYVPLPTVKLNHVVVRSDMLLDVLVPVCD